MYTFGLLLGKEEATLKYDSDDQGKSHVTGIRSDTCTVIS